MNDCCDNDFNKLPTKILPLVYDSALSYSEQMCNIINRLNELTNLYQVIEDNIAEILICFLKNKWITVELQYVNETKSLKFVWTIDVDDDTLCEWLKKWKENNNG